MPLNRLGDIILELSKPETSEQRKTDIVRTLNELGIREEKYKSWLRFEGNSPRFQSPIIDSPQWEGSALGLLTIQRIADVTVSTGTNTYITFDTVKNFSTAFSVSSDGTKVHWNAVKARGFSVNGYVIWAANGSGYRAFHLEGFDTNDVSLGTAPLHTALGNSLVDNVLPVSLSFYFNNFSYLKFYVYQSSGGNLTLKEITLGVTLA